MALEQIKTDGTETGETAATKINTAFGNIDSLNDAASTLTPKGAMSLSAPLVHNLNDATYVEGDFDVNVTSRGGVTVDLVGNFITVTDAGNYEISFGVDCDFPAQEELVIAFFLDDVIMSTTPFSLQGGGNGKPNSISWTTTVPVEADTRIDMRFINGDSGTFDANIRRMFLSVKLDV